MMKGVCGSALTALLLLAGCGGQAGEEYVGKWISTKNEKRSLTIERNGESFLIRETAPSMTGKIRTKNLPATLQDGLLQAPTGFGFVSVAIDKETGNLTASGDEYRRE
jgi:hypothetical protein